MSEFEKKYEYIEDINIGSLSVGVKPLDEKYARFSEVFGHFSKGDIIYFKSRKIRGIPFEIINIKSKRINKEIFGLESTEFYITTINLENHKINKESPLHDLLRIIESIQRGDDLIYLEDEYWYPKLAVNNGLKIKAFENNEFKLRILDTLFRLNGIWNLDSYLLELSKNLLNKDNFCLIIKQLESEGLIERRNNKDGSESTQISKKGVRVFKDYEFYEAIKSKKKHLLLSNLMGMI